MAANRCATVVRAWSSPENREVGPKIRPGRGRPVRAPGGQPGEVGADGRRVGPLGVEGGVSRSEGTEKARQGRIGRRVGRRRAHASGAGSTALARLVVVRGPLRAPPRACHRPSSSLLRHRRDGLAPAVPAPLDWRDRPGSARRGRCPRPRPRWSSRRSGRSRTRPCGRGVHRPRRGGRRAARDSSCSRSADSSSSRRRRCRFAARDAGRDGRRGSSGRSPRTAAGRAAAGRPS